jgi:predicted nucleotidyltransferase
VSVDPRTGPRLGHQPDPRPDPQPDPQLVARLRGALACHPEVRLALLFGSQARGAAGTGSDVDVAVEGAVDRMALAAELGQASRREVDVLDLREAGYPLLRALLRDGVVLREGEPHAAARFRTRAILETETDRPWFERMRDAYLRRLAARADGRP